MKAVFAVLFVVAAANAGLIAHNVVAPHTVIARAPALDSAVIQSDRIGGNFAYSVSEAHAHVAHTPIIQHVATPVAVTHHVPAVAHHVVAAPVARTVVHHAPALAHHVVAAPVARAVVHAPALGHHLVAAPHIVTGVGAPAATVRIA